MARKKNALRKHELAPLDTTNPDTVPTTGWLPLSHWVTNITDDSEENTETYADYSGDGTEIESLIGRSERWTFEGTYDPTDPTHIFVESMKRKSTDEERICWHRITQNDGKVFQAKAKLLEIKAGGGDAQNYEDFSGRIDFLTTPTEVV